MRLSEVLHRLDQLAPLTTAEYWDNVGLLLGDPQSDVKNAIVAIDLSEEALKLAEKKKANLIVCHHPCIFNPSGKRGLNRVVKKEANRERLLFEVIKRGINVAAYHTNFDRSALEVGWEISKKLGLTPIGRLWDSTPDPLLKLVVFVPSEYHDRVREAVCNVGAGHIGNYSDCTFATPGEGTFKALKGAKPFLGQLGELERAQEVRLETILPSHLRSQVLQALFKSHPYEEVAYDLYPLAQDPAQKGMVNGLGYGVIGEFKERALSFPEVARRVKNLFKVKGFLETKGSQKSKVRRVGFVAGKGSSLLMSAIRQKCDLFITGEVGYHAALESREQGLTVWEMGHTQSELFYLKIMSNWLKKLGIRVTPLETRFQALFKR
jgi:dinuclear metal center YbgI/SA1388 family protein